MFTPASGPLSCFRDDRLEPVEHHLVQFRLWTVKFAEQREIALQRGDPPGKPSAFVLSSTKCQSGARDE